jgi:hypothetical protein
MNKVIMKQQYSKIIVSSVLTILFSAQINAATYCGWIDDAKFGANLTDGSGVHNLSSTKDKKSGQKVTEMQEAMKSWPSCGCVTGALDKSGDFSTVTAFTFKSTDLCKAYKNLATR